MSRPTQPPTPNSDGRRAQLAWPGHTEDQRPLVESAHMVQPSLVEMDSVSAVPLLKIKLTLHQLAKINAPNAVDANRSALTALGGVDAIAKKLAGGVSLSSGLKDFQVGHSREYYGSNEFPPSKQKTYLQLLAEALSDTTLIFLMVAAIISVVVGVAKDSKHGWYEGVAILVAVALVAAITSSNNYSKQLQFRSLQSDIQADERCCVLRHGAVERLKLSELVVGDILVVQAGEVVPADAVIITQGVSLLVDESSLTGEAREVKKGADKDCFLLSSSLVCQGEECRALVIGVGRSSQWGQIRASLVGEVESTPLQQSLARMAARVGAMGMAAALVTALCMAANGIVKVRALKGDTYDILRVLSEAFIMGVTVLVVAIPEGLPLAVTLSLAYSTKEMYKDHCFIRTLAACETLGNATNICSDKTGTLTTGEMTVVCGFFGSKYYTQDNFAAAEREVYIDLRQCIVENICVNRSTRVFVSEAKERQVIGNKTEGALLNLVEAQWHFTNSDTMRSILFDEKKDRIWGFSSEKKRSTAIVNMTAYVRLYCKGASEMLLRDCSHYSDETTGEVVYITSSTRLRLLKQVLAMSSAGLRTIMLCHRDFDSISALPKDWRDSPPDKDGLVMDCILGIRDPLRADVKEAVAAAQRAGITVRMITGDNLETARAVAVECGILSLARGSGDRAMEGSDFRLLAPAALDALLPRLKVIARSSPTDKLWLVQRLNGCGLPATQAEWEAQHPQGNFEEQKTELLPGYREEWQAAHGAGAVVGVTGDGTNDAPALKAANVGLAMGSGTKVATGASDMIIVDDNFATIVTAVLWGRCIYDNIRKFLQFQLTVNSVALVLVMSSAILGLDEPLTSVQMLWTNLIMDSLGALALATERPSAELLKRRPYRRDAPLVSAPMLRNIAAQAAYQLCVLYLLLFRGAAHFGASQKVTCQAYSANTDVSAAASGGARPYWSPATGQAIDGLEGSSYEGAGLLGCAAFAERCPLQHARGARSSSQVYVPNVDCYESDDHAYLDGNGTSSSFTFSQLEGFAESCLLCEQHDYTLNTIIFNTFIFCQVFNEINSRRLFGELNVFQGLHKNYLFLAVIAVTIGVQYVIVTFGGEFSNTTPLGLKAWLASVLLGAGTLLVGVLQRLLPVHEGAAMFAGGEGEGEQGASEDKDVAAEKNPLI